MESRHLLSKLPPLKPILCLVATTAVKSGTITKKNLIGTALSDPYLGYAFPLSTVATTHEVEEIIKEHRPGALVFGLPMLNYHTSMPLHEHAIIESREKIFKSKWNIPLRCKIDERLSLDEALSRKEHEWHMWDDFDPTDGTPSTEAAVALNAWLYTHCGGWHNTFG